MPEKEEAFRQRLLETFRVEADEHLKVLSSALFDLEKAAAQQRQAIVETAFRAAHSLKGAARAVNVSPVEATCQSLESVLAAVKRGDAALSPAVLDALNQAVSGLEALHAAADFGQGEEARPLVLGLTRRLDSVLKSEASAPAAPPEAPSPSPVESAIRAVAASAEKPVAADTVRIATAKLDAILLQAEEMVSAKLAAAQLAADLQTAQTALHAWKKKADRQASSRGLLADIDGHVSRLAHAAASHQHALSIMVDHLLDETKKAAMQSVSSLLDLFPRLVRNLARDQGKLAELVLHGADIEVDRRILEEMKDPLIHAIRNCIDHGIETPQARAQAGKPETGSVGITVLPRGGGKVEIIVADDGMGIDADKVKGAAVRLGLVTPEKARTLDEQGAVALIFESGVTTNPAITDISGRGLGLAILREKVEKLGGRIHVETRRNAGTTLRILLPLALATFRGVLVKVAERAFVCPTIHVERVLRVLPGDIRTVENRETIELEQKAVALVRLGEALGLADAPAAPPDGLLPIVLVRYADTRIGFAVERIVSEQEFLVKGLGSQLARVANIAGATLLGDGQLIPILNAADLIHAAGKSCPAPGVAAATASHEHRAVLVVDDSITTRTLLKNILESNGWRVKTAVDGIDALTTLQTGAFDIVVSDVDMPRMNGFELTVRLRADAKLTELPVVLVTSLESREDRERGIDAGANAYIVKSSFDQSTLLDVMNSLV